MHRQPGSSLLTVEAVEARPRVDHPRFRTRLHPAGPEGNAIPCRTPTWNDWLRLTSFCILARSFSPPTHFGLTFQGLVSATCRFIRVTLLFWVEHLVKTASVHSSAAVHAS